MNAKLKVWLIDTGERALRTFAQTFVATGIVGSGVTGLTGWKADLAISGVAALAAVLNAIIAVPQAGGASVFPNPVASDPSAMGGE